MMEALPDLQKLSDSELKALPQQLQDITLKALDGYGVEMQAGNLTLDEANAKGDQMMRWTTAQQELIFAEHMRRIRIVNRKRMIIRISLIILVVIAVLAMTVLEALKLPGVL